MNLSAWLQELKRRRVFRALAGYGLVAFAVLQVVEPVMHGLGLPEWVLKVVVVALGLGLPVTILLAWAYDLKATGIERAPSAGPGRGWRTVALVAIGLLLAAPGVAWYLVYRGRGAGPAGAGAAADGPSVAVLPFVNMSGDPENEYFSDGLSEEILNALAQVPGLRVPARTSSFAFKGKAENVKKIAAALEVATVLEGSVRKAGGRVRITAQLVKAVDGYHLWSQTFDRELKDVFAVQDEIAAAITGALKLRLAPAASAAGSNRQVGSTSNTKAYEAYLKGRHDLNERTRASIEKAIVHFDRALALDPAFAVAYADKAIAVVLLGRGNYGQIPMSEAIARARPVLATAQSLAPDHPEVLAAAGLLEANADDPEKALQYVERSLALNPNNGEVLNWRKGDLEALGRYELVLSAMEDAARADPLSKLQVSNLIFELDRFGRDAELGPAVERLRRLDEAWAEGALGDSALFRGDRSEAVRHLLSALQQGRDDQVRTLSVTLADLGLVQEALRVPNGDPVWIPLAGGDPQRAEAQALEGLRRAPGDTGASTDLFLARYAARQFGEAAGLAARIHRAVHGVGLEPSILVMMADAARGGGRGAEASSYRDQAQRLIDSMGRARMRPSYVDYFRGKLAAYDGRDDEAVARLRPALTATGWSLGRADLELPVFDRLRRRPDYLAALKGLDANLAAQRKQVVELLCGSQRLSATWPPAPETCAGR